MADRFPDLAANSAWACVPDSAILFLGMTLCDRPLGDRDEVLRVDARGGPSPINIIAADVRAVGLNRPLPARLDSTVKVDYGFGRLLE
jgi:hypothetical protein